MLADPVSVLREILRKDAEVQCRSQALSSQSSLTKRPSAWRCSMTAKANVSTGGSAHCPREIEPFPMPRVLGDISHDAANGQRCALGETPPIRRDPRKQCATPWSDSRVTSRQLSTVVATPSLGAGHWLAVALCADAMDKRQIRL